VKKTIQIHPKDNVQVALQDLHPGDTILHDGKDMRIFQDVPAKHKFTIADLEPGDKIFMYGVVVGTAKSPIKKGGIIGTHNVGHATEEFGKKGTGPNWIAPDVSKFREKTFMGYHRSDGQVGTANYWLVVPLVFCENRNVDVIRDAFEKELGYGKPNPFRLMVRQMSEALRKGTLNEINSLATREEGGPSSERIFPNIDGIKFLTHDGGCGGTRQDSEALCQLIAGYIHHPNVAGATVLSLGCQHAQASILKEKLAKLPLAEEKEIIILEQQKEGTERQLLTEAIKKTFLALVKANENTRQPATLDKLTVGLECGGSDGFSGISANPAVGHASDLVVALGGKTILSEFPELCGVEQELIDRCVADPVAERFSHLMKVYAAAAEAVGSGFDMNPSPGNIKDGLITDAMKSAGAAKKGGTSPVADVLDYGEYIQKPGLNLLCTPGNDVESTTAMAGSGANIILFTTGLGTPTGNPVAPVIKISSNSALAKRMPDIIDLDTGPIIRGEKDIAQMGEEILELIIAVASGEVMTKASALGQDDFIPWKRGVSL
jgi:altronate hydrolase